MDEKPTAAEPGKQPRRRWYQFRLRTLLIGTAAIGMGCVFVMAPIRNRQAMIERIYFVDHGFVGVQVNPKPVGKDPIPWYRRLLGDSRIDSIHLPPATSMDERRRIGELFPEATLWRELDKPGCYADQWPLDD